MASDPLPGDGFDGKHFGDMLTDPEHPATVSELLELYASQGRKPSDKGFGYPPALPPHALPSPNSALAPLIWEPELPIPDLEEVA